MNTSTVAQRTFSLTQALEQFSKYQHAENQPKYASAVCVRVAKFIDHCRVYGLSNVHDVGLGHVMHWLGTIQKDTNPGAWKSRHLAVQTFFNWCVFMKLLTRRTYDSKLVL